tara:strand:- start:15121 stop:15738 length:618 start_codon:yes stop_codon:yes gene_type:complete
MPKEKKILLVLGKDKIISKYLHENKFSKNIHIRLDNSNTIGRIIKLLKGRRISIKFLIKTLLCEMMRKHFPISKNLKTVNNNYEIEKVILELKPDIIVLFRAGLIINKRVLSFNIPIYNIHCAKIPEFGGLGAIDKAIKRKILCQAACLYKISSTIDDGIILSERKYFLNLKKSYFFNENIAYQTGLDLLSETLNKSSNIFELFN